MSRKPQRKFGWPPVEPDFSFPRGQGFQVLLEQQRADDKVLIMRDFRTLRNRLRLLSTYEVPHWTEEQVAAFELWNAREGYIT